MNHVMYKTMLFSLLLSLTLLPSPASALAGQPNVADVTAALDRARGVSEVSRLVASIEPLASNREKADYPAAATQLARAYYLLGEDEGSDKKKTEYMDKAIGAADGALGAEPESILALYWRSMAQLQKADAVGGLTALSLVKDALRGLEKVAVSDPQYDDAGAYRIWGKVLIEAPAWAFIGDRKKGLALLLTAKDIAPKSLLNRLYLAQAYEKNGRDGDALAELSYIEDAPVNKAKPGDDLEVKKEAARLARRLRD